MRLWKRHVKQVAIVSAAIAGVAIAVALVIKQGDPNIAAYVSVCALIFAVPTFIVSDMRGRWEKSVEDAFPQFIVAIAENQAGGMDPLEAVKAAETGSGPLKGEIAEMVRNMLYGVTFEKAFKRFALRLETPFIYQVVGMITEGAKHGDDLKLVLDKAAEYAENGVQRETKLLSEERARTIVMVFAFALVLALLYMLMPTLLPALMTPSATSFLHGQMTYATMRAGDFQMMLEVSLVVGILTGKLGSKKSFSGLKYSALLILTTIIFFALFI